MIIYTLYFDGACWPNPGGTASYGFVLSKDGKEIETGHGVAGNPPHTSNNLAEHAGVCAGFEAFLRHYDKMAKNTLLEVRGDSDLVIRQLNRKWRVKPNTFYYKQGLKSLELLQTIKKQGVKVTCLWIPRAQNDKCDMLSKIDQ